MDPQKTPGLYIHIPFCLSKCPYCDFYSTTFTSVIPEFLKGLFREMERYRHRFDSFDTVYIGGGTPSLLSPKQLEEILSNIRKNFDLIPGTEMTLEANPADLNPSFLKSIRHMGIGRINIGIQSFDEKRLRFLGRRHSVKQAISAIEISRDTGFQNIGIDLIYGIPGQKMVSWLKTLKQAVAFLPEHLSCYQLTLEPKTVLGQRGQAGEFSIPGEELQYEFFIRTSQFLEEAGYIHYEVSNFARGWEHTSRHNQKYWDHTPYLGLGPSAHSFQGNQRWWNFSSLNSYLDSIRNGNLPIEETESLTKEQLQLEALYLGLRTKQGISLKDYQNRYESDLLIAKRKALKKLEEEGFITIQNGHLQPTPTGLAIADRLALI